MQNKKKDFQGFILFICRLSMQHIVVTVIYGAENAIADRSTGDGLDHLLR